MANLRIGDLRGKHVLDIGAWDGYFSFAAERAVPRAWSPRPLHTVPGLKGYGEYRTERLR